MSGKKDTDIKGWQIAGMILFGIMSLPAAIVALLVFWLLQLWDIDGSGVALFIWVTGTAVFWIWLYQTI